ncbi:helix-turn-helix domain-containing protein [Nocardia uniformis]|uniref:Helix-turn-helix domain-containing protein n=1 Tax=Nocardia uniformis TaxID=53432 RepID=A0A849C0E1_9NOCA|nr:helix-turn-helix transcriptional regulator [Nocardia uniformis]NNH72212.1 helix-turn-helix domain-containing protein [Nocardia uniformis]
MAQSEFAEFLIARRAQLQPEEVGLPPGRRRRTPGLRREEVAALAGVSVDYLARLEQGRDSNPSTGVLNALADALRLNDSERHHFAKIALGMEPAACPGTGQAHEQLTETVQAVIDALQPTPAFVLGRRSNILGSNASWRDFATPLGLFDEVADSNLVNYLFAHPEAPQHIRNWPDVADMFISSLRAAQSHWSDDEQLQELIHALQQFPEFARRWHAHRVGPYRSGILQVHHPIRGNVEVEFETMNPTPDQTVTVWFIDRRRAHTPSLRLVNE